MRDLTVADIHIYYVLAGSEPVLVHNNDPGFINLGVSGGESCPVGSGPNAWTPDRAGGSANYDGPGGWTATHGPAKDYATPGGPTLNWEHVVEQSQGGFPAEWINHPDNMMLLDSSTNFAKNGFYSKKPNWAAGRAGGPRVRIRDMLKDMPFHQQWDFGMWTINTIKTYGKRSLPGKDIDMS